MAQRQPEGKLKDECRKIAISAGLLFWNIEGKSTNGVPDTLCTNHLGRVVMVEFKVPGKSPNDQQWLRIHDLREQGVSAWYATSVEEWEMLVGLRPNTIEFVYPPHVVKLIELGTTAAQAKGHSRKPRKAPAPDDAYERFAHLIMQGRVKPPTRGRGA